MESLLVGVTLVSLALAAAMAGVAWKLLRSDRERSAARADALHALAFDQPAPVPALATDAPPAAAIVRPHVDHPVHEAPPGFATTTAAHEDSARMFATDTSSPAVTHPAAFDPRAELDAWDFAMREPDDPSGLDLDPPAAPEPSVVRVPAHAPHFAVVAPVAGSSRLATLTIAGLVAAAAVVLAAALWSSNLVAATGTSRGLSFASLFAHARPLELLSLRNTRGPEGGFVVTGLVENPAGGSRLDDLEAVVYLFDRDGRYFASGHATIEESRLDPGEESPFVVTVRNASAVSRYRVGFRQHDGGPVTHVDRRGQLPADTPDTALADTHDASFASGAVRPGTGLAP
jgi:hypothetical protein